MELSDVILSPGIKADSTTGVHVTDYTDEIRSSKKKRGIGIQNQDKAMYDVARVLTTGYPYVAMVGSPGIGKSLILDYIIDILTKKRRMTQLRKQAPDTAALLEQVLDTAERYEHRQYLFLPNLENPLHVKPLSYTNEDVAIRDEDIAEGFCYSVADLLNSYAEYNRDRLCSSMTLRQFERYVTSRLTGFYEGLYGKVDQLLKRLPDHEISDSSVCALVTFEGEGGGLKATWDFLHHRDFNYKTFMEDAGIAPKRTHVTKDDIERGLADCYITEGNMEQFQQLVYDMVHVDIKGGGDNKSLFWDILRDYNEKRLHPVREKYQAGTIRNTRDIISHFQSGVRKYVPDGEVSTKTLDHFYTGLDSLLKETLKEQCSPGLRDWMTGVVAYFKREKRLVKNCFSQLLTEVENAEQDPEFNYGRRKKADEKTAEKKDGKKKETDEKKPHFVETPSFVLPHGDVDLPVEEIFEPRAVYDYSTTSKGVTWTKITDPDTATVFASFYSEKDDVILAPHQRVKALGNFFQSSILLFKDSFGSFIKHITDDSKGLGSKEQFLEYLQTGILTMQHEGVAYELEAPRIILSCDNNDPFLQRDGLFMRDEAALRERIKTVYVPDAVENTVEARQGSLAVIQDALKRCNEHNAKRVQMSPEACNMLLQSTIAMDNSISLRYRFLSQQVEDIAAYTLSKGHSRITPQLMKERLREDIPPDIFRLIDSELEYYAELPAAQVGNVHGLALAGSYAGVVKVNSYFRPGCGPKPQTGMRHFELVDGLSAMTGKSTYKGFELAQDFMLRQLSDVGLGEIFSESQLDWKVRTHFRDSWDEIDGPSASMAITISLFSALADEPVYKNRFITGAIYPEQGDSGLIGGAYLKGMVPKRIRERTGDMTYFLFPRENLKDLWHDCIFDPFTLEDHVVAFPVKNFAEAYHLYTCGPVVSEDDWTHAEKYGRVKMAEGMERIRSRFGKSDHLIIR
ncbi:MAG: hypothetical protein ACQESG_03825 [Nanobdellota archaeon]